MITHDSRDKYYRMPFGAVTNGTTVILRLSVDESILPSECRCIVSGDTGEIIRKMQYNDVTGVFECTVDAASSGNPLFYYFTIEFPDGRISFYGNNEACLGGTGMACDKDPLPYQITVYDKDFMTPDWFREGPVYHIFVDRFRRGGNKPYPPEGDPRYYHTDWYEKPLYSPHGGRESYLPDDFFGGNLEGIIEKLDYISGLGARTIYLSPIFRAYSNHKYDTGDYDSVDPAFGDNNLFSKLCEKAAEKGMGVLLDGVFSHTGDDSIYFNRYGSYDSTGAYQSKDSPYYEWYSFEEYPDKYDCWWDFTNMPTVVKENPGYCKFINGKGGITSRWVERGASGWRLDVADELPMEFLSDLRDSVKTTKKDSLIIGEVWEDASNKVSYGEMRNYCYGDTLDSVMNYPLRTAILGFLTGSISPDQTAAMLDSQLENYPVPFINCSMNMLGSHDRARLRTVLSGAPHQDSLTREEQADYEIPADALELSEKRVQCAAAMMFTLPGVPHIYYGDEVGMTGMTDPFNRCCYPWGRVDEKLLDFYKKLGLFRKNNRILMNGTTKYEVPAADVLSCIRTLSGNSIVTAVNRNETETQPVEIQAEASASYRDVFSGKTHKSGTTGVLAFDLPPLSFAVLESIN